MNDGEIRKLSQSCGFVGELITNYNYVVDNLTYEEMEEIEENEELIL